ncbi:RTA1 like protein-domain-containing protein [Lipomyces kononenkoae]|uniref:RTA1 like protein-domain-containing protein n=1 Tax=Lipomyces kononenkoae TaxID=34357 RepID=A0ACC3SS16_LIPKO
MAHSYYAYTPSHTAAMVFAILFSITNVGTVSQSIRYRAWVWIVMVVAGLMESLGYIARSLSSENPEKRGLFIGQFCLIVLAPVLMAAACYIIFGRLVYRVVLAESRTMKVLWVPPGLITPIFVMCDIVALLLQLGGAVVVSGTQPTDNNAQKKINTGKDIALAGLAIQIACFGFFSVVALRFNIISKQFDTEYEKLTEDEKYITVNETGRKIRKNWRPLLRVINVACILILIRSVYRVCDFALGKSGYLEQHEWPAYAFDAAMMLPCLAIFVYWNPGKYLPYVGFRMPKSSRVN